MNDASPEPVRTTAAAIAAGLPLRIMQDYLSRRALPLIYPQADPRARFSFCPADIIRYAVLGQLTGFGLKVSESADVVTSTIDPRLGDVAGAAVMPWQLLAARFAGEVLYVSREPDSIAASMAPFFARRSTVHGAGAILCIFVGELARSAAAAACSTTTGRPVAAATGE